MLDRVEISNLPEELESRVAFIRVREVCEGGVASVDMSASSFMHMIHWYVTYGHDRIETIAMPMMIADLTRKAMSQAVRRPPKIPSHICTKTSARDVSLCNNSETYLVALHDVIGTFATV